MLKGERALELRDKQSPAAEAGDFSEFTMKTHSCQHCDSVSDQP